MTFEIVIDDNRRCKSCGRSGATQSGVCLKCGFKAMANKKRFGGGKRRIKTEGEDDLQNTASAQASHVAVR